MSISDIFLIFLTALLGWMIGLTLNYLAEVLPKTRSFSSQTCRNCGKKLSFVEMVFPRPCDACSAHPSRRTWILLGLTTVVVPLMRVFPAPALGFWLSIVVFFYLAVVLIIDIEHRVILHEVSIAGAILAIPFGLWLNGWMKTLLGVIIGFGVMLALYYFGILFNRWMSRARGVEIDEVALGFGDVILSGVLGLFLGSPRIIVSLFFAILIGGLASGLYILITILLKRYKAFTAIPYAPFLILAAVVLLYMA